MQLHSFSESVSITCESHALAYKAKHAHTGDSKVGAAHMIMHLLVLSP